MSGDDRFAIEELSADECWAVLGSLRVGRLGLCDDGRPAVFPVNYVVQRRTIVFRTAAGSKLAASRHAEVAFEVDDYDATSGRATSVMIAGRADEISQPDEWAAVSDLPLFPWHVAPKAHFVRIEPATVTGRRFLAAYAPRRRPT